MEEYILYGHDNSVFKLGKGGMQQYGRLLNIKLILSSPNMHPSDISQASSSSFSKYTHTHTHTHTHLTLVKLIDPLPWAIYVHCKQ